MNQRRDIFQAVADPTRRDILSLLARKPHNVNTIAEKFDMTRQAVSLHVKILQECGVMEVKKEGRERHCSLKMEKINELDKWIDQLKRIWERRFDQLDQLLAEHKTKENE